ncbi:hypothetical protein FSARC_8628 [Fusarium sarcochroum]|uniref:Cupin type-1 domain-containing protein n=1 Tax=Fusarium sarcochroum TaxID=1208366 RepID=A0A8H4TSN0_9HYPO|nr:hypothetical protein FSARC_8628 [Fusarium sarcochroum]
MCSSVECYLLPPTEDAPNSRLPILVYRNVLPHPRTEETATEFLTTHRWEKRVGHLPVPTYHAGEGMEVSVKAGDVVLLPAGTAHSSTQSSPDYKYIGVYPQDCPRWRNERGKRPSDEFISTIQKVDLPEDDPVYGKDGPVTLLWYKAPVAKL